jgi:hypothetical protein
MAASSSLPWFQRLAAAQGTAGKNLVVVFAQGGWDTTAHIDPKPDSSTIDSLPGQVRVQGDLTVLTGEDRPAVLEFFQSYADISCLVRGIEVRSIAHQECTKRIFTGTSAEASPDIGAVYGNKAGGELAIPYMVLGNTAYPGEFAGSTGRTGTTGQLATLLRPEDAYPAPDGAPRSPLIPTEHERALIDDFIATRGARDMAARGYGPSGVRLRDYLNARTKAREIERLAEAFGERTFQLELSAQMDLAVRFLKEGVCRAILIEDDGEWDTHYENNMRQVIALQHLYSGLHSLANGLDREGLLENTVVAVISEMSRTPKLNDAEGKDHWPVTSALLFGGPVKGGAVVGATNDLGEAEKVRMNDGQIDESGEPINSSNFVAGVLGALGVQHLPEVEPLGGMFA